MWLFWLTIGSKPVAPINLRLSQTAEDAEFAESDCHLGGSERSENTNRHFDRTERSERSGEICLNRFLDFGPTGPPLGMT